MNDSNRRILAIGGNDRRDFLQGLVTNDVPSDPGNLRYSALLSPQGKYLCDFMMFEQDDTLFLDAPAVLFDDLVKRLTMYRLRRKVTLSEAEMGLHRGTGPAPAGALADPRHPALGWRLYGNGTTDNSDFDAIRVQHLIPEAISELIPNDSYILEFGFETLNGVDFRKGCYVGQEVTARMKHKIDLKKGLGRVRFIDSSGTEPELGSEILADGKPAGRLGTRSGDRALAWLRFSRATGVMHAGETELTLDT